MTSAPDKLSSSWRFAGTEDDGMVEMRLVNVLVVMGTDGTVSDCGMDVLVMTYKMNSHERHGGILVNNGPHIMVM